ncbi:MAG TPA: DUF2298 domain-containing protein [Thermoanaerobaculaceae bacterium]|nr:DUF2298 domain-containing protein [Thermoanaerobaculaceae bacterium]
MGGASARFRWQLAALFVFSCLIRLYGLDWDGGHFFHPDERRIAEAVHQLSIRPWQWNPHFFAYGSFPIYVTKLATSALANVKPWFGSYDAAVFGGRALSALWGAATVALLALLGRRLYGEGIGLLAGGLLSITVLHVQNSHFATTDVPLAFLVLAALAAMTAVAARGRGRDYAVAGLALGFAAATKFSALPLFLPLALAAAFDWRRDGGRRRAPRGLALALLLAAVAFVAGEPYALLDSRAYLHDILEQSAMVRHAGLMPYTNQYVGVTKVGYDLGQLVAWGMGPPLGLAALAGTLALLARPRRIAPAEWVLLAWVVPFAAITFSFDVKFLRYLLPLYPILVLWGGVAMARWAARSRAGAIVRGGVVATSALYLLAFLTIYARPHATVTASDWFYQNVSYGSRVLSQDWDEGFPLPLPGRSTANYRVRDFAYYEPDSPEKVASLSAGLASSDWVVFQTKRLYGAVTRAPAKFPLTSRYFYRLFAGELGFTLVKDVTSRPRLLGVELPDELADESFSVYDHPKALFFRNTGHLSAEAIEAAIVDGPPGRRLSRDDLLLAHAGGPPGPTRTMTRSSLAATALCVVLVELLGFAALALLRAVLPPRPGLPALAKVVGLLLFAYLPWLGASLGWLGFARPALLLTTGVLLAAGWLAARRATRPPLPSRDFLVAELVFWGAFGVFLGIRLLNPEVTWGEKPMDFAFLNTLYRVSALPPPEPWFAGSTLNYTYFGHFLVAAIGKTLAIDPAVMFNLGIAVGAGLTAAALLAAGSVLGGGWRTGVAAVVLTELLGNLSGLRELLSRHAVNFDYFWATSRVIPNTINEYPFWSFVFADLHAHVLAMPWAIAFVGVLLLWVGRADPDRPRAAAAPALLALAALLLGATAVTNGWSMPTYAALLVVLLGIDWLACSRGRGPGAALWTFLGRLILPAVAVGGGAWLAFAPFWRHFAPPPRQWGWEVGPYARPFDFLTIFGTFLVVLVPFMLVLWRHAMTGGARASAGQRLALLAMAAALVVMLFDLRSLLLLRPHQALSVRAFATALATIGFCLALHRRVPERARMPVALAAFAFALTAGCELVFVWDRMNTVFKFYLDAWLLLGLAAAAVAVELLRRRREASPGMWVWRGAGWVAAGLAAFTAVSAAVGAQRPRRADGPRFTLDGTAYLQRRDPFELAAFDWLNREISGAPVLCEAWGPSYQDYSRVSMNTGLPIVLGWDYHVYQRGHTWIEIERRKADLATIYGSTDEPRVAAALRRYGVAFVFAGQLERRTYDETMPGRFRRWTDLLTVAYENPGVTIFAVRSALAAGAPTPTIEDVPPPSPAAAPPEAAVPAQEPAGLLRQPRGIAAGAAGNLYVCDFGNDRVQEFGPDLKPVRAWGRLGSGQGEFRDPCGIAVGPDRSVYVADTWNSRVQVFGPDGRFLRSFAANFFAPRGIAVDALGKVFVADTGNNRVVRFSAGGDKELEWGGLGDAPGRLREPVGVAVDAAGLVYVCDNSNGRLQVFTRDGAFVRGFEVPGWRRAVFSEPFVAVGEGGSIWLTVPLEHEVREYAADGRLLHTVATDRDSLPLRTPLGIALRPGPPRLVVSDGEANAIRVLVAGDAAAPAPADRRAPPTARKAQESGHHA